MKAANLKNIVLLAAAAALLAGCGTSTVIKDDGTTDEPKWHDWDSVHFDNTMGTFPNLKSLSQMRTHMTKDQVYELIGRPQYYANWRAREWDYLFHFHTPGVGKYDITTCQYKVLYDKDLYTGSFHWNPVDPPDAACPPSAKPKAVNKTFTLGADALFDFDRSGPGDMNAKGRDSLDKLAEDVKQLDKLESITVIGYTDRLGSVPYNQRLSQNRANTVKAYLAERGIPRDKIRAIGRGKADQIEPCPGLSGQALRDCLHPNRRVVLEIKGYTTGNAPVQQSGNDPQPIPVEGVSPD
ncbi:MAG: OmpA family protein [Oxalobacter sp.]|nr:OmpA family protein [Oxalobacter sp.]